jgi:hypothetical protein
VRDILVDGRVVVKNRRLTTVDYDALVEDAADLAEGMRRDYREHFERMSPAIVSIAETARRQAARPLPHARWAAAGDDAGALGTPPCAASPGVARP